MSNSLQIRFRKPKLTDRFIKRLSEIHFIRIEKLDYNAVLIHFENPEQRAYIMELLHRELPKSELRRTKAGFDYLRV
jgi:hypothetical protein